MYIHLYGKINAYLSNCFVFIIIKIHHVYSHPIVWKVLHSDKNN